MRTRTSEATTKARRYRKEQGATEAIVWRILRDSQLGFKFKRQVPIGRYFLDFYCAEAKLCVEIDGEQHVERPFEDALRDDWLSEQKIETIRIPSLAIFDPAELSKWINRIVAECERRAGRPASPE